MARCASLAVIAGLAGLMAGCVYDPVSHAFEPCCAGPPPQQYAQTTPPADPPGAPHEPFIERFRRANVTNDGKLTLEQARAAGMHMIVNHFAEIDTAHKGYVTLDDLRAARAAHQRQMQQMQQGKPPPPPPAE
jgi:hypothetical protein